MKLKDTDIADIVGFELGRHAEFRPWWRRYRSAMQTEFWSNNLWSEVRNLDTTEDGLPFKVEVNRIQPFISSQVSNLFYRMPRTSVQTPAVLDPRGAGRPKDTSGWPDLVSTYLDEWLSWSRAQTKSTKAYELALLDGWCAIKQGYSRARKGSPLQRMWVSIVPAWECIWDRTAEEPEGQAYRGHLRWERVDRAAQIVGVSPDEIEKLVRPEYARPYLDDAEIQREEKAPKSHVRLLEFYDLREKQQMFYIVDGDISRTPEGLRVIPVGDATPMPYSLSNDDPAPPLTPVVLAALPDQPLNGIPAVARVYRLNAEQNLMLTVLANAVRRDAGRAVLHDSRVSDSMLDELRKGRDLAFIKVDGETGNLANLFHALQVQPTSTTIDKMLAALDQAWSATQGTSDLQQGKQGKYLSATESSILAGYGEAASSDLQQRMANAVGAAGELQLRMIGEHAPNGVDVKIGDEWVTLTKEIAHQPWAVGIVDAAATPIKDQRKRDAFVGIQPVLLELTKVAAGAPGEDGQPANPALQRAAKLQLNYMVQLFGLPDEMSWDAIEGSTNPVESQRKEAEKLAARGIVQRVIGQMQQPQGAPPVEPPVGPPVVGG